MLKNILKSQNILLRNSLVTHNRKCLSDFKGGLIQHPPKKTRLGRTKLLMVMGSGTLVGAYTASCMVSMLESFEFYPDAADPDDY